MKIGDLVTAEHTLFGAEFTEGLIGIVVDTDVNMWGEEVVPTGISVLWSTGDVDTVYEDEINALKEAL
mgnify:CR=1 FL=1